MMTELDVRDWSAREAPCHQVGAYDVFVDLSSLNWPEELLARHIGQLQRYVGFASSGARMTVAVGPAVSPPASVPFRDMVRWIVGVQGWQAALQQAALERRALLVVLGQVLPPNEILLPLWDAMDRDPLIGMVQPRFSDDTTDALVPLPGIGDIPVLAREVIGHLPAATVTAEMLAAVTLLRGTVVESLAFPFNVVRGVSATAAAVLDGLVAARRRGFRNLVVGAAVVPLQVQASSAPLSSVAYPHLALDARALLLERFADAATAERANATSSARALDLAASGLRRDAQGRLSLLLDCRGVSPVHNGTSQCILGLLRGMAKVAPSRFDIHVLSRAEGAQFHGLCKNFPEFHHCHEMPSRAFAAALIPNQPWSIGSMAELHRHAWALVANMLDTIAWDIVYAADDAVESAWHFVANYLDGIAFNSAYTQARFGFRFPMRSDSLQSVVHHSLEGSEHVLPQFADCPSADHVLIFGNHYDHKDVAPTVAMLSDAFPEQSFVLVGRADVVRPNVRALASGSASFETVHELMASARCVVYPSFYEGFGLPLVESLAYRKVVLVRASHLWVEIAAHSRLPGKVVQYETAADLVESLGQTLAGLSLPALPSGVALAAEQPAADWAESANRMLAFVQSCIDRASHRAWLQREQVFRIAGI